MPYLPLPNFNHDSGPRRIQSGPDHEGYVVLYSGVESTGADDGFAVLGAPLSGTAALGAWDYDSNWRYVPSTLPSQSGSLDPTPYNVSGALDTYDATRIYTRDNVAGAQAASAIGPETGKVNPRGGALQPRADVTRPETYMYYGGAAPDNQDYSPYNTPDANSAAEGKTGGGVTHKAYESSLLTNVLGSQGTSDRSQWRYHQPVYCKTYTETRRSETPGLMSTPLRYVYRGSASSYNYNYGSELLANKGGFELLPYDDEVLGCPFPVGCPTNSGSPDQVVVGDTLSAVVYCPFVKIEWFNSNDNLLGAGLTYTTTSADVGYKIYYVVTYPDGSTDRSSTDCFGTVLASSFRFWYRRSSSNSNTMNYVYSAVVDDNGDMYVAYAENLNFRYPAVSKVSNAVTLQWSNVYVLDTTRVSTPANAYSTSYFLLNSSRTYIDFFAWQWASGTTFPIRIYRNRVSKDNGSLLEVRAVDWTPPGSPSALYFEITDVKIDSDNNYYMVATLAINTEIYTPCIVKFTQDLTFQWCRVAQKVKYRNPGSGAICVSSIADGTLTLEVSDSGLIGSAWRNSFEYIHSNYFSLSSNGDVLATFKSKFSTPSFSTDGSPFHVRSICRDSDGNVYGIGSYDSSVAVGRFSSVIVYKDSPSDVTLWAKDIRNTFYSVPNETINLEGNQLLVIDSKLVLVAPREFDSFGFVRHHLLICVFNLDTGVMEKAVLLIPPNEVGDGAIIQPMPENTKFIVQTAQGYRIRLDVNSLPSSGTFTTTDNPSVSYTASGMVPVTSDAVFYKFDSCGASSAPGFIARDLSPYFTSVPSPVVTVSGATGAVFNNFAGQDLP